MFKISRQSAPIFAGFLKRNKLGRISTPNVTNGLQYNKVPMSILSLPSSRNFSTSKDPNRQNRTGLFASAALGLSLLAGKTKYALVALKLTKAAPLASMVISSFAYSFIFGWPYAVGMVGLIFCHECGHLLVMRHYGMPFTPMVFIPFMGAVIGMKEPPKNAYEDAMIAFGGPVGGSVAAFAVGAAGGLTDSQLLYALADFGYMINLFNLMPIGSMDGGRIGGAISPWFGVLGIGAGGMMIYSGAVGNPLFYVIMLSGVYSTTTRLFGWDEERKYNKNYYNIKPTQQIGILTGYIGLIAGLLALMVENNRNRKSPKQLEHEKTWGADEFYIKGKDKKDGVYDKYF